MGRLEYADIATATPDVQQLAEQIALERGGRLINLYRTLLLSPGTWKETHDACRSHR